MPPNLVAKKTLRKRQPFFALSAVGLVLILLCWWAYFAQARSIFKKREAFISGRIEQLSSDQRRLNSARKEEEAVREGFDSLTKLVEKRTRWVRTIEEIHASMQDGMWLTAIHPMSSNSTHVTDIEIVGQGFSDKMQDNPADTPIIEQFRNRLSSKSLFTDETKITYQPVQRAGAHTREFTILIHLKEPMQIR